MRLEHQKIVDIANGMLPAVPITGTGESLRPFADTVPEGLEVLLSTSYDGDAQFLRLDMRAKNTQGEYVTGRMGNMVIENLDLPDFEINPHEIGIALDEARRSWKDACWNDILHNCIAAALAPSMRAVMKVIDDPHGKFLVFDIYIGDRLCEDCDFGVPDKVCEALFGMNNRGHHVKEE